MPLLRKAIFIIVCVYVGVALMMAIFQKRYIFFPEREHAPLPQALKDRCETVVVDVGRGVRLYGWIFSAVKARGTILIFHGNAGNISDRYETVQKFLDLNLDVVIFDYRGYGHSQGSPSEKGFYHDAHDIWHYLTTEREIPPEKIIIFGRSLGGSVAAWLASEKKPRALILESAFTSLKDMARITYPFLPIRYLLRYSFDTVKSVQRLRCPLLVMHGPLDEVVPFEMGQRIFDQAPSYKEFFVLRGGHQDGWMMTGAAYDGAIQLFLSNIDF